MAVSQEQIDALADAIATWRMQEYIWISFYCFYVYYVLTTMHEEVALSSSQKWSRGRALFTAIRYGTLIGIGVELARDYRNYFVVSPGNCKVMLIVYEVAFRLVGIACNISLGLCLSALLQAKPLYMGLIVAFCAAPSFVTLVFTLISDFQYPAEAVGRLDEELGYACYVPSTEQLSQASVTFLGRNIRSYVFLSISSVLLLLAVFTIFMRYKGQKGRLVNVIRRDGGLYYLALTVLRFWAAVLSTPAVISVAALEGSPASLILNAATSTVIPVLAQRLLINIRTVDYMGSQPLASKLLFAPPGPGSEDESDDYTTDTFESLTDPPSPGPRTDESAASAASGEKSSV